MQPMMTQFVMKKKEQDDAKTTRIERDDDRRSKEDEMVMMTTSIVESNINNTATPALVQNQDEKPARVKVNVRELTKLFNGNQNIKPSPPLDPKTKVENVPIHSNGRRPSKKTTGQGTSAEAWEGKKMKGDSRLVGLLGKGNY